MTANGGKVYLRAKNTYFNKERTYLIDKIRSIEETSLKFSEIEKLKGYDPYLHNIKSISSNKEVKDNKKLNEEIDNELIKYYIKALKLETLMEVSIDYRKEKIIYIDKNDCIACSLSSDYERVLKYNENKVMQEMIEVLSQYPDNTIYLGYPYISINSLSVDLYICPSAKPIICFSDLKSFITTANITFTFSTFYILYYIIVSQKKQYL